jgi:hypothetical protein
MSKNFWGWHAQEDLDSKFKGCQHAVLGLQHQPIKARDGGCEGCTSTRSPDGFFPLASLHLWVFIFQSWRSKMPGYLLVCMGALSYMDVMWWVYNWKFSGLFWDWHGAMPPQAAQEWRPFCSYNFYNPACNEPNPLLCLHVCLVGSRVSKIGSQNKAMFCFILGCKIGLNNMAILSSLKGTPNHCFLRLVVANGSQVRALWPACRAAKVGLPTN